MPAPGLFDALALRGRVAVLTGAAGGLGLAIGAQLRALGAQLVQVDIGYPEGTREADGAMAVRCDLADPDAVAAMAEAVAARFGRCDVLVNNAAMTAAPAGLESLPLALWDRVFQVNVRGALLCAQAFAPLMFAQQAGSIVNVASIAARSPTRMGAYGTAKGALLSLTHQMAVEWGPRGLRANAVSPGLVRTPLSEAHYRDAGRLRLRESRIPARRIGRPGDIASAVPSWPATPPATSTDRTSWSTAAS